MSRPDLAIVIPAFRREFFETALSSVAGQGDRRFRVYVGIDGDDRDLERVARSFAERFDVTVRRFERRLGPRGLTRHWERCVAMTSEPWLWLFGDDDVMDPGCVGDFHAALSASEAAFDVYRFQCSVIDAAGARAGLDTLLPRVRTAREFLAARLARTEFGVMQAYVFRRGAYRDAGGFVHLPLAWNSDDASCYRFARRTGLRTVDGAVVHWRQSGGNLSSFDHPDTTGKLQANIAFLRWLRTCADGDGLRADAYRFFLGQLPFLGVRRFGPVAGARVARAVSSALNLPFRRVWSDLRGRDWSRERPAETWAAPDHGTNVTNSSRGSRGGAGGAPSV